MGTSLIFVIRWHGFVPHLTQLDGVAFHCPV